MIRPDTPSAHALSTVVTALAKVFCCYNILIFFENYEQRLFASKNRACRTSPIVLVFPSLLESDPRNLEAEKLRS